MAADFSTSSSESVPELLDEIAQLAKSDLDVEEFYLEVIGRLGCLLQVEASTVSLRTDGGYDVVCKTGEPDATSSHTSYDEILSSGQARIMLPRGDVAKHSAQTPKLKILCPVVYSETQYGVIELVPADSLAEVDHQEILQVCDIVCELVASYHRDRELRELRDDRQWRDRLNQYAEFVHRGLELDSVCYTIANEGRRVLNCDRVTIVLKTGSACRVRAVSGLETVNRRANAVKKLERLAQRILAIGEVFEYPNESEQLPASIQELVLECLNESNARCIAVIPLHWIDGASSGNKNQKKRVVGGIVVEQFASSLPPKEKLHAVAAHTATAVSNVQEHRSVFLLPLWSAIGKLAWLVQARTLPKSLFVLGILATVILSLCFVQTDFELIAQGTLQPRGSRFVFAPNDGVVESIAVSEGSEVDAGGMLLKLRSSEIQLQLEEINGELQTTIKKIAVIKTSMADASGEGLTKARFNQMAAEQRELETWRDSLIKQRELLTERKESLTVRAPIRGEVITPNVRELLAARPVTRGQILMTVARLDGEWQLNLLMPDNRVGHLNDARKEIDDDLPVNFILATEPETTYAGKIASYGESTIANEDQTNIGLQLKVDFEESEISHLRPGARVTAKVHCGRRPLGYVWFHDIYEFFYSRVIFRWS